MNDKFERVDPWPALSKLREIVGLLRLAPDELRDLYALDFVQDSDDLDYFEASVIRLPSGRLVALLRHRGNPAPGTEILVEASDDRTAARAELLRALNLPLQSLSWSRPEQSE
jgi:hypothetical protein